MEVRLSALRTHRTLFLRNIIMKHENKNLHYIHKLTTEQIFNTALKATQVAHMHKYGKE
jgi:hypothetical protein